MNDPNKKIEIDKSSLLSLKAELLRKQEEVSRAKTSTSIDDFVPKRVPKAPEQQSSSSAKGKSKPSKSSDRERGKPPVELEDSAQLDRSKKVLIAKSKYYDRMMASGGSLNSDENCLVMFNQKKQTERPASSYRYSSEEESEPSSSSSSDEEDRRERKNRLPERDDDMVEYTDYLGRSRKCLRKELNEMLRQDREMEREARASRGEAPSSNPAASLRDDNSDDGDEELIGPPVPSMASSEDTIGERYREMREQWAKQEAANLEKDSVHYSDVLFDEARQHGVGYYAFSTDRDERNRQQLDLDAIREATVDAQREKEQLRVARDRIIADRVRAAKARQRARLGLPPEEEKPESVSEVGRDELYDTEEERKRAKAEAKAKKKREKEERRRERERKGHVRPWDEGKEQDVDSRDWKPAKEWRVMTQEEWNEMQRMERNSEFAPPVDYGGPPPRWDRNPLLAKQNNPRVDEGDVEEDESDEEEQIGPLPPSSEYEQGMEHNPLLMPPPTATSGGGGGAEPEEISMPSIPGMEDIFLPEETPTRALFFTTKKKEFKRRNYETTAGETAEKRANLEQQRGVPIRNELSEDEDQETEDHRGRGGVEIAPPPTFDYYGPTGKGQKEPRKPPVSKTTLEASIEAGLKFLRNQSDKAGPSGGTKNRWTSNADY